MAEPPNVTEIYEELMRRKPKELRTILAERGISTVGLLEKEDYAKKIIEKSSRAHLQ